MTKKPSATDLRSFRTFLLMQQFAAKEIGARIAQARREAGAMTQEQLAELLNVSTRSVQDYEGGTTIPWKHFQRLEQIFEHDLSWFLHGEKADPEPQGLEVTLSEIQRMVVELDRKLDRSDLESRLAAIEERLRDLATTRSV